MQYFSLPTGLISTIMALKGYHTCKSMKNQRNRTDCFNCPFSKSRHFRSLDEDELSFVTQLKSGEMTVDAGAQIFLEGAHSAHLFTVLEGWVFRYKTLEDGRRQILNFALPGDFLGLQGSLLGEMQHSVEALSEVVLCVFERRRIYEVFSEKAELALDITWLAAREERFLDENLLSIGRRTARERAAYLLAMLYQRALGTGMGSEGSSVKIPVTQQHVADMLGLSIVHTNRTLRTLAAQKMIKWADGGCVILNPKALLETAEWDGKLDTPRPYL